MATVSTPLLPSPSPLRSTPMKRRQFLKLSLSATVLAGLPAVAAQKRKPRVLLRNGWQSINIGDIAHYIGMMELFEKYDIDADVRMWTVNMENGADALFRKNFPKVPFFTGGAELAKAFQECDFLLHGSKSGFGTEDVKKWVDATKKPFGVMGVSLPGANAATFEMLNKADFV